MIGLTFYSRPCKKVTVAQKFNDKFYLVEELNILTGETCNNTLLTPEYIENELSRQEEIIKIVDRAIEYEKEQKEKQEKHRLQEIEEQKEFEEVNGYCDNMKPMTKGKILKVLNKSTRHENKTMTKKEFVYQLLKEGYTPKIIDKYLSNVRKVNLERIETYKYNVPALEDKEGSFYVITKTEYDYSLYLLNNILQPA